MDYRTPLQIVNDWAAARLTSRPVIVAGKMPSISTESAARAIVAGAERGTVSDSEYDPGYDDSRFGICSACGAQYELGEGCHLCEGNGHERLTHDPRGNRANSSDSGLGGGVVRRSEGLDDSTVGYSRDSGRKGHRRAIPAGNAASG